MSSLDKKLEPAAARFPTRVYTQRIVVPFEYPVCFTRDVFAAENPLLEATLDRLGEARRHRAAVFIDSGVIGPRPDLVKQIKDHFHDRPAKLELAGPPEIVPGGEIAKNGWETVRDILWTLGNLHLDRQSYVIAVGGGSMLDMVGFATSIVHRGLRMVRVPTTVLAQNDAGVGVKTGMDEHGQKNFIGTFAPPFAVINDFAFLASLRQSDWIGGVSEAFKVALIKDAAFFDYLCTHADALRLRDEPVMEEVVRRTAILHLEHIAAGGDPFEFGTARPLDFGHWAAHRIEIMSDYVVGHGQAVAVGVAIDSYLAMRLGLITETDLGRIIAGLTACGLPLWYDFLARRTKEGVLEIQAGLEQFREHLGGALTITLPDGIGRKREVHAIGAEAVEEAVAYLWDRPGR
jgi:3-dehydroquinate synthase